MADATKMHQIERDILAARASVEADIAALDERMRADKRALEERMRAQAATIIAGGAALGVLAGVGGARAFKLLLMIGIPVLGAALYARQRQQRGHLGA